MTVKSIKKLIKKQDAKEQVKEEVAKTKEAIVPAKVEPKKPI
jgi:hypothetical protein